MFQLHIQLFEIFHHDDFNLFSPNRQKSTAEQDFKFQLSKPDTIRSFLKKWERNNWKMEFGHLLVSSVFAALVFLVVCTPVERTPETTLNCFSPIFADRKECFTLLNS